MFRVKDTRGPDATGLPPAAAPEPAPRPSPRPVPRRAPAAKPAPVAARCRRCRETWMADTSKLDVDAQPWCPPCDKIVRESTYGPFCVHEGVPCKWCQYSEEEP